MVSCCLGLPTLHRGKYLCGAAPSEGVTHEFYRQLYPNIIRDIDVRSVCMLSFHMLYEIRELWVEGERKYGREGRGTGEEWGESEGMGRGIESNHKDRGGRRQDGGWRGLSMREMRWGRGRERRG